MFCAADGTVKCIQRCLRKLCERGINAACNLLICPWHHMPDEGHGHLWLPMVQGPGTVGHARSTHCMCTAQNVPKYSTSKREGGCKPVCVCVLGPAGQRCSEHRTCSPCQKSASPLVPTNPALDIPSTAHCPWFPAHPHPPSHTSHFKSKSVLRLAIGVAMMPSQWVCWAEDLQEHC